MLTLLQWSPVGGENGTIIVSCGSLTPVFTNQDLGAEGSWKTVPVPEGVSYTRHLRVFKENPNHLFIMGAGHLPPSTTNKVTVSLIDLARSLKAAS